MLGLSYGEIFLILGATAALIGPKDLPVIGRTAGRLAGRAIGYVQLARGQFDSVMQQSQARQVHKELQDTMVQLEAIRHEIRSISIMNPGPSTRRLVDDLVHKSDVDDVVNSGTKNGQSGNVLDAASCKVSAVEQTDPKKVSTAMVSEVSASKPSDSSILHTQAIAYAKVAESSALKHAELQTDAKNEVDLQNVLPVSAESAGLLPKRPENMEGSDILLEAIVEAEMAHNSRDLFARPENQIKYE